MLGLLSQLRGMGWGGSSEAVSVRAPDQNHDAIQFYFFAITPFPHRVVMLLFTLLHIMHQHLIQPW